MENQYDVGIANRYALFLEEGENELTTIKKKLTKELRAKNKQEKKENAEAKKIETVKAAEKPKKPEPAPISDSIPSKKGMNAEVFFVLSYSRYEIRHHIHSSKFVSLFSEGKENKNENPKVKERKPRDQDSNK